MGGKKFRGMVQIYTGDGKGKTTAAVGLAVRAAGRSMRSYIGQFMKGQDYGELHCVEKLGGLIEIEQFGKKGFVHIGESPSEEDIRLAREGIRRCREKMLSGDFDIIVLDEINVAVFFKLVDVREVLKLIEERPEKVELVLTGRYAPDSFIEKADLVTEMREVKHYYTKGIGARDGIER